MSAPKHMDIPELETLLTEKKQAVKIAEEDVELAKTWLLEMRQDEREVRNEIDSRYAQDREKLRSWNESIAEINRLAGR